MSQEKETCETILCKLIQIARMAASIQQGLRVVQSQFVDQPQKACGLGPFCGSAAAVIKFVLPVCSPCMQVHSSCVELRCTHVAGGNSFITKMHRLAVDFQRRLC